MFLNKRLIIITINEIEMKIRMLVNMSSKILYFNLLDDFEAISNKIIKKIMKKKH